MNVGEQVERTHIYFTEYHEYHGYHYSPCIIDKSGQTGDRNGY